MFAKALTYFYTQLFCRRVLYLSLRYFWYYAFCLIGLPPALLISAANAPVLCQPIPNRLERFATVLKLALTLRSQCSDLSPALEGEYHYVHPPPPFFRTHLSLVSKLKGLVASMVSTHALSSTETANCRAGTWSVVVANVLRGMWGEPVAIQR